MVQPYHNEIDRVNSIMIISVVVPGVILLRDNLKAMISFRIQLIFFLNSIIQRLPIFLYMYEDCCSLTLKCKVAKLEKLHRRFMCPTNQVK